MTNSPQPLPGWLAWPVRIIAVIVVVPFRLAWDLIVIVSRFLWRYLGVPVAKFVYAYVLRPLGYAFYYVVWIPLHFLLAKVLWTALVWLAENVLAPFFKALWRATVHLARLLKPFLRLLGRILLEAAKAVAVVVGVLYALILRPLGIAIRWTAVALYRYLLRPVGLALAWLWQWIVVPVAKSIAWAWNHSVVLLWRYLVVVPLRWTWQTVVAPTGRWIHAALLAPIAEATRRVLATIGLR
jgi:hypothetical protein